MNLVLQHGVTVGDVTFLSNKLYSDLFPEFVKEEAACVRAAYKLTANDPDGYDGMVFCRWTADAIGNGAKIDWEKYCN